MLTSKEFSAAHEIQIQKLREELKMSLKNEPTQRKTVDKEVKSLVSDFLCHQEKVIVHLSDIAIQFYRMNKIRPYRHVLELRDSLMLEIDG